MYVFIFKCAICFLSLCLGVKQVVFGQNGNIRTEKWKIRHSLENRYEGTYEKEVGNPLFELVSMTGYLESYTFDKGQQMQVAFFVNEPIRYRLHAEECMPRVYYWMEDKNVEAKLGWNTFRFWPVDRRLEPFGIVAANLGVLVELEGPGSKKIAPALVYHSSRPNEIQNYIASVRLGRGISKGQFNVYRGMKAEGEALIYRTISEKYGGSCLQLYIETENLDPGWYTIELSVRLRGTLNDRTFTFSFYHQPLQP